MRKNAAKPVSYGAAFLFYAFRENAHQYLYGDKRQKNLCNIRMATLLPLKFLWKKGGTTVTALPLLTL